MAIRSSHLSLAAVSALSLSLAAQSTGVTTADVKGYALSLQSGPVAGASVRLISNSTNQTRTIKTDGNGDFAFRLVPPGSYTIIVEAPGFTTQQFKDVQLRLGTTTNLAVDMNQAEAAATVEVVGENTLVDPGRTQVSTVIDNTLINNLPISRRRFEDFSLTTPGVATANSPENGGAAANSGLSFAGANPRQNNIMVDGLDNNDVSTGSVRSTFSQEAVQEFQVIPNGFSAEIGRAAGGTVNVITKSGGNEFAGSVFFFRRDSKFDALRPRGPADAKPSGTVPFTQNQYGATVGGALVKDRLFYFVSVERFERNDSNNVAINPVVASSIQQHGYTVASGYVPYQERVTTGIVKLDWVQSDTSKWSLRYTQGKEYNENQLEWGGLTDRGSGGLRRIDDQTVSLSNQWVASSKFVNDFRFLASNRDHGLESLDTQSSPYVAILGFATYGTQRFLPQTRQEKTYELADTASFFFDKHSLKVGVDLTRTDLKGQLPLQFAGLYRFGGLAPNIPAITNGFQAYNAANPFGGTGLPQVFVQGFNHHGDPNEDYLAFKVSYHSFFLQDDWQITPKFTLKLGVRYDREELPEFQHTTDYDYLTNSRASRIPDAQQRYNYNALLTPSYDWSSSHVSPRVAFSWQVTDKSRIYGGHGHFAGRTQLGPFGAVYVSNGQKVVTIVQVAGTAQSPWGTWAGQNGANSNRRYSSYADVPAGTPTAPLLPGSYGMPITKQSNLGWEWAPRPTMKWTLDLVYARGTGFLNVRDVNAIVSDTGSNRRPDANYGPVNRYDGTGESKHSSQSLGMVWQVKDVLSLTGSYTHSKSEDNYIDWLTEYTPQNTFDTGAEWGPSNQQQRHRFLFSGVYNTRNATSAFGRNWTIALIGKITSGRPYTQYLGFDANANGDATSDRPAGMGRNSLETPWVRNMDLRLSRTWGTKTKFEFIAEVFNVFNHYNVTKVQSYLNGQDPFTGRSTYGDPIVASNDFNRQVQLGARFTF